MSVYDPKAALVAYQQFIQALGLESHVQSLPESARLASELLVQRTSGVHEPTPTLSLIDATDSSDWMTLEEIPFYSLCEHHFVPFWGTAKIAYIPNKSIAGLGGFMRIIDHFARQPQLQERLTQQITDAIFETLKPKALKVTLRSRQMCLELRGQAPGIMIETNASRGES